MMFESTICLTHNLPLPTIWVWPSFRWCHFWSVDENRVLCIHLGRETGSGISVPRLLQIVLKNKTLIGWLKLWSQLKVIDVGKCCFSKVANSYLPDKWWLVLICVDWCWLVLIGDDWLVLKTFKFCRFCLILCWIHLRPLFDLTSF